jgi:DNA-directed RNA polymerase III subunit RPC3
VLVQENLVYHNFEEDTNTTHYEANPEAAYMLVRSGKIVEIVEGRYGALGADVVGNLFLIGHGTVKELVSGYESRLAEAEAEAKKKLDKKGDGHLANGVNGQSKPHPNPVGQMHGMLTELLEAGFIQPLFENMFRSPTDTYNKIEKDVLRADYGGSTKGIKQKEELKVKIQTCLQALRSEREWKPKGKKRTLNGNHANGVNGTNKRRRLSIGGGAANGDHYFEDDGKRLDVGFPSLSEQDTVNANLT